MRMGRLHLTNPEIDHNFSRAHRIVTSSILPIVEQYGSHSRDVWEGSKASIKASINTILGLASLQFWKQFFESSANVSLSGYEEQPSALERQDDTATDDTEDTTHTTLETSNTYDTPTAQHISTDSIEDTDLSNLTISPSHSTPRAARRPHSQDQTTTLSQDQSLYEESDGTDTAKSLTYQQRSRAPETPGKQTARDENEQTLQSSPFLPPVPISIPRPSTQRKQTDPLLHRVLDRNYRVQATPLTASRYTNRFPQSLQATPTTTARNRTQQLLADDSMLSSPEPAAPELHAEIFTSPQRQPTRTPGISVLTPAANRVMKNKTPVKSTASIWDDTDDDLDDDLDAFGHSPPKTMQFHIPQQRLLQTPGVYPLFPCLHTYLLIKLAAKEASQRIVQDLLSTAGVGRHDDDFTDEIELDLNMDDSPSMVRQAAGLEDETF